MSYPWNRPPRLYLLQSYIMLTAPPMCMKVGSRLFSPPPTGPAWNMLSASSSKPQITRQSTRLYLQGSASPRTSVPKKSARIAIQCSLSTRSTIPTKSGARTRANR
ncbi:hypothetical protein L3X38_025082 [Prunus dulcis]|uniref:Uncharacterized protein n=1 Tax=Prunus dulcis TaxID=3755 RepID=A0AAD4W0Z5_PRUDU|nr:hypothetical protein L3X38_025082 [Prunus dulcis]